MIELSSLICLLISGWYMGTDTGIYWLLLAFFLDKKAKDLR